MSYFIGVDGGGSKTKFLCVDSTGSSLAELQIGSTFYRQKGLDDTVEVLRSGVAAVRRGIEGELSAISFGLPGYGETPSDDAKIFSRLSSCFSPTPVFVCNDAAAALYGAFAGEPGILIVAGTGSIAWGIDDTGREDRCGGWSHLFGDEGSGYWIGAEALRLFSKESDGRLPKTKIYTLMRERFSLAEEDCDISSISEIEKLFSDRREVAALQKIANRAALCKDKFALEIYARAVEELSAIVCALFNKLSFRGMVPVSYVGGLFNCRELILEPMRERLTAAFDARFQPPLLEPCQGALLYCISRMCTGQDCSGFRSGMIKQQLRLGKAQNIDLFKNTGYGRHTQ